MIYSIFETCHLTKQEDGSVLWITERVYYRGDLSNVNCEDDWRFTEIKGKRKLAKFIGLIIGSLFENV